MLPHDTIESSENNSLKNLFGTLGRRCLCVTSVQRNSNHKPIHHRTHSSAPHDICNTRPALARRSSLQLSIVSHPKKQIYTAMNSHRDSCTRSARSPVSPSSSLPHLRSKYTTLARTRAPVEGRLPRAPRNLASFWATAPCSDEAGRDRRRRAERCHVDERRELRHLGLDRSRGRRGRPLLLRRRRHRVLAVLRRRWRRRRGGGRRRGRSILRWGRSILRWGRSIMRRRGGGGGQVLRTRLRAKREFER